MSAVAFAGWLTALCGAGGATWLRARLARHAELVADAGHELRGPLCAARVGLYGLGDSARAAAVDLELRRAALALDDLVAAGRGRRAGERSGLVDVGVLLDDGAEAWRSLALAFDAAVTVEPLRGRALVRADPVRLAQACGNLVANALEHGVPPVRVRGRVVAGRVRVEVSDAGAGLPAPVAELVAGERHWRSATAVLLGRHRRAERGRGLAIAARIAESYGGRLSSAPSPAGARLVLELPSADAAPGPEPFELWGPELRPRRPSRPDPHPSERGPSGEDPFRSAPDRGRLPHPSERGPSGEDPFRSAPDRGRLPHPSGHGPYPSGEDPFRPAPDRGRLPHPFPFGPTRPRPPRPPDR